MRLITFGLLLLLALVQAELWAGEGGRSHVVQLQLQLQAQQQANDAARLSNQRLAAEVSDLKEGLEVVEEKARAELGMVKPDEILVQLSPRRPDRPARMDRLLQSAQPLLAPAFSLWGSPVTWLEVLACVLSLAMVVCNMRVNVLAWPLAIAASLLYGLLFWDSRLYGEASLQLFFVAMAGWGWWQWLHGRDTQGDVLRVRRLSARGRIALAAAVLATWPLLGAFLRRFTDTDVPWWDALPTAGSVAGQWLLGRKYVDNWPVWLAVNLVSSALFAYKGLWLTVLLYALFALLSLAGWRAWARKAHG